jgi:ketosteroid isomerase-like protein
MTNADTVQSMYEAFGRGDIPFILDRLADDVEWEYSITPLGVPWLDRQRGRAAVPAFFASLAALEFHRFQPKTLLERGNIVVALIDVDITVKATGTRIAEEDEVHIWYFDDAGRVVRFGHKLDTHRHWLACGNQPEAAAPASLPASGT